MYTVKAVSGIRDLVAIYDHFSNHKDGAWFTYRFKLAIEGPEVPEEVEEPIRFKSVGRILDI